MGLGREVELPVAEAELGAAPVRSGLGSQPQQRAGWDVDRSVEGDGRWRQWTQPGRRLAVPDLLGEPWAKPCRIEVLADQRRPSGGSTTAASRLPTGTDAANPPAAMVASRAWRTTRCHVIARRPTVRCDDEVSTVSAACGNPRGRYRQSPLVSVRSSCGSPSSSSVGRGIFWPPDRVAVRGSGSQTRHLLAPSSCTTKTSWKSKCSSSPRAAAGER